MPLDSPVTSPAPAGRPRALAPPPGPRPRPFLGDVLLPFLFTRAGLLLVAWLGRTLPYWTQYGEAGLRGFGVTRHRLLDVWGRWDTGWYLSIATQGYDAAGFALHQQSKIAFFPVYPLTVRGLWLLLPRGWRTETAALALAVLVANAAALAGLALVRRWMELRSDRATAARGVALLLAFPTAFFLSAAMTESTFLLLAAATFLAAERRRWWAAGLLGAALSAARPTGVLMVVPLAWLYAEQAGWDPRRLRADALALLIAPLGLVAWAGYTAHLTGDPLAFMHVQRDWGKALTSPWATLAHPALSYSLITPLDTALVIGFGALGLAMLARRGWRAYGLSVLLPLLPIVTGGTLASASRYVLVLFPAFLAVARRTPPPVERGLLVAGALVQGPLAMAQFHMYWVG